MRNNKLILISCLVMLTGQASGQTEPIQFVPFNTFLASIQTVSADTSLPKAASAVNHAVASKEMRQHILAMYQGITVAHSYILDAQHIDCVPIEQQPTVNQLGITSIATPPPNTDNVTANPIAAVQYDNFGNAMQCEEATIPLRRITLEDMQGFGTLRQFLSKNGAIAARTTGVAPPATATTPHNYEVFFQTVNNLGGASLLDIWSPPVNNGLGEQMSLSQQWYVGGSGANTQTAEVGWQVMPSFYHTEKPTLFIYWTADQYTNTGCYNLTCPAFVQVSNAVTLGSSLAPVSLPGGATYNVALGFQLFNGNWWLKVQGTWVGYYPASLYNGGQMANFATLIEFGGEVYGTPYYPAMGSGQPASAGFGQAAAQHNITYISQSNTATTATLKYDTSSNFLGNVYSSSGPFNSTTWGTYFYFGGQGTGGALVACLLDWGELSYSSVLSPQSNGVSLQFSSPYTYRYYPNTQWAVGVSAADNHLYYDLPGGAGIDLGSVSTWTSLAGCY